MSHQPPPWNGNQDDRTIPSDPGSQPQHSLQAPQPSRGRQQLEGQQHPSASENTPVTPQAMNWWQRFLAWFRLRSLPVRIGIGCGGLIVAFLFCAVCAAALGIGGASTGGGQATPSPQSTQVAIGGATATATVHPTASPTPKPTDTPTNPPTDTPVPLPTCIPGAVNCNPWGYNFNATGGRIITSPPADFCSHFNCITNFSNGQGYVVQCHDNTYSESGGKSGSCSRHGGDWHILYRH